MKIQFLTNWY